MGAVRHLGLVVRVFGPPTKDLVLFVIVQNLVGIDTVVSIKCMLLILRVRLENLRPQKLGFGGFDTLMGSNINKTQKGTSLRESASFESSCAKIHRRV